MKRKLWIAPVLVLALCLQACPFGGKPTKVSDLVIAARVLAGAPVTLKAVKRVAVVLQSDGTLSAAQVAEIYQKTDRVKAAVDQIAGTIEAGKFDDLKADTALPVIEKELSGVLAIFGKSLSPEVRELIALANALIPSIRNIINRLKPVPVATPLLDKAGAQYKKNAITPAQVLTIALILAETGAVLLDIRTDSDLESLRQKFHQYSQSY